MRTGTLTSQLLASTVVVAGCASDSAEETTAGSLGNTTTPTVATTTTTAVVARTTTTTTTTALPTTSTTLLDGNWADLPVITSALGGGLTLGWWDGSGWAQAEKGTALPVVGGEDYQVALLDSRAATTTGGPQIQGCDIVFPSDLPAIELSAPELLTKPTGSDDEIALLGVAISAGWDLTPHQVSFEDTVRPGSVAVASRLLADRGLPVDQPVVRQTLDVDLDGDRKMESLVVAEETELANSGSGVYSMVFHIGADGDARVVDESVIPEGEEGFPVALRVGAVADLNGDGLMEVVIGGYAWEGIWVSVHEFQHDGTTFARRLGAGCGV